MNGNNKETYPRRVLPALFCALTLALSLALTACGGGGDGTTVTTSPASQSASVGGYYLTVNGVDIQPGMTLPTLGTPDDSFCAASCAIEGWDKTYTYGSILVSAEDNGTVERITGLTLLDDGAATREGITVGDSREKVLEVYGPATSDTASSLSFTQGGVCLKFLLRDGSVISVSFSVAG